MKQLLVDSYNNAPAQLVANKSYTINMKNKNEILDVIRRENQLLFYQKLKLSIFKLFLKLEKEGFHVIPNADALIKL